MSHNPVSHNRLSRRQFLRYLGAGTAGLVGGNLLSACVPPTPEVKVVKETVEVVKEVPKEITPTPAAPLMLTLWHHWGGTREPLLKKALDDFAARNPGITVEPTLIPWDRKEEAVMTAVAAGQAPDVLMLNAAEMPPYAINNVLLPLDEWVTVAGITSNEVYDSDWKASFYNGKQWGLPQTVGGAACLLFYNTAAFEEAGLDPTNPPRTWAEMLSATKTLLKQEGDKITRLGLGYIPDAWGWLNFLAQNDALWLSSDGREVKMNNDGAIEALQFIVDISDAQGGAENIAAFMTAAGEADPFISGRAAMTYQGVWQYFLIKTNAPDLPYMSTVAPNNKGPWHEANYGPHLYTLPAGTKHVPEAWKLLLWLTREDGGCNFLMQQLRPSPWKKCTEESPIAKVADYWPVVVEALNSARSEPLTPLFNQFASIWNEMIERATRHQGAAAEVIMWASEEMRRANEEFWAKQEG